MDEYNTSTTPSQTTSITSTSTTTEVKAAALPQPAEAKILDYLSGGFYKGDGAGRYMDPDLVDGAAKKIAKDLAAGGMKQSAFNPILRELKRANKKTLPLEAKRGALVGAIPQAKQLVQRHRAPELLVEILERNRSAVQDSADYTAAVKHLIAVNVYLGDFKQ